MSEKDDKIGQKRRAVFPLTEVKVAEPSADDGKWRLEGFASVFGVRDVQGDIVVQGAFERTLRERPDVKVLYQHDIYTPIGKQESGYETEFGLAVRGVMSNTNFFTGEVLPLLQDGVLTGLSIGYEIVKGQSSPDGYLLQDLELFEWSPVTFAANELASVSTVKSLDNRHDRHTARVMRAAKALDHELSDYFGKSVRLESLDLAPLRTLHATLAGRLRAVDPEAADATGDQTKLDQALLGAYQKGLEDGLNVKQEESAA